MTPDEAYQWALANAERNDDGGIDERKLAELIAGKLDFDADAARWREAKKIVDQRKRPGRTEPDGQLAFEGMEPFAYEPGRLVADDGKHVVEHAKARPEYISAAARRAQTNAERAVKHARRWQAEASLYADWAMAQLRKRRRAADITVDTFVRESGIWSDRAAPPDDDGGPD